MAGTSTPDGSTDRQQVRSRRARRTYQGRTLPRQGEDLDDQGLAFDLGTMLDRRRLLGLGFVGLTLAACGDSGSGAGSPATPSVAEIPDEIAGPYPGDGSNGANVLARSGVVRQDIRPSFDTSTTTAEGVPLTLTLQVIDMAGGNVPFEGAAVYLWHADRSGNYSLYATGLENENYLRGVQVADAEGKVTFTSIFPACYVGRWPHVHIEVYPDLDSITSAENAVAVSQIGLPENACTRVYATPGYEQSVTNMADVTLESDLIFMEDAAVDQMATGSGDPEKGYRMSLTFGVDTRTAVTGGTIGGQPVPKGFPTDMPSGFPTEMPSGFPTDMPSGFPTAAPAAFTTRPTSA